MTQRNETTLTHFVRSLFVVLGIVGAAACAGQEEGAADPQNDGSQYPALTGVSSIAAGRWHACASLTDGSVRCWGYNGHGQLGTGDTVDSKVAQGVASLSDATSVAVGSTHSCALLGDRTVRCWGANDHHQLGDGTTNPSLTPVSPSDVEGVTSISAGRSESFDHDHTCVAVEQGGLECWGQNSSGQLGGVFFDPVPTHSGVASLGDATVVWAGGEHSCSLVPGGGALGSFGICWGNDASGQLGDGKTESSAIPMPLQAPYGMTSAVAGGAHTCATMVDTSVMCWGDNTHGQLGDGTTTNRPNPTLVQGLLGVVSLSAGCNHTCALLGSGMVACWGQGVTTTADAHELVDSAIPVIMVQLTGVTSIAAGCGFTCATLDDGTARCWGDNSHGQLGTGDLLNQGSPAQVHSNE